MNNRIIDVKIIPDSHKEERRIQSRSKIDAMTTHCCGTGALHEINGRENFGIIHMLDGEGNITPEGKIEMTHAWHRDGRSKLEMRMHQEDFWFRNVKLCVECCEEKKINLKHWKRTREA